MDEAVAVIAAHLGIGDEEEINSMSLPFFNSILSALGRKLNYESISNLYGNSFCKDASKYIQEAFPLSKEKKVNSSFINAISQATVIQMNTDNKAAAQKALEKDMGDMSWAEGLF